MKITEIRVKLMEEQGDRLLAFCSITLDHCFVIRDLKIIEGTNGPFVAMPSRKLTRRCPNCRCKNHLKAGYCNQCGQPLLDAPGDDHLPLEAGQGKYYADIAHPINSTCREMLQCQVIKAYKEELEQSRLPGYVSSYGDYGDCGEEGADYIHPAPHFNFLDSPPPPQPEPGEQVEADNSFGAGIF